MNEGVILKMGKGDDGKMNGFWGLGLNFNPEPKPTHTV